MLVVVAIVHAPAIIALVLSIIGATNASSAADITNEDKVKAGICLYIPVLAALILLELWAYFKTRQTGNGEPMLVIALLIAFPFILVRLIYALLTVFSHGGAFGIENGSETAALCMSVLEEMVVVLIYIVVGLKLTNSSRRTAAHDREHRGQPEGKQYA